jgi:hypothetical protein
MTAFGASEGLPGREHGGAQASGALKTRNWSCAKLRRPHLAGKEFSALLQSGRDARGCFRGPAWPALQEVANGLRHPEMQADADIVKTTMSSTEMTAARRTAYLDGRLVATSSRNLGNRARAGYAVLP